MSKRKSPLTENDEFPGSIASKRLFSFENIDPSMNVMSRGRTIDRNEDSSNRRGSVHFNCEFDSKENAWIRVQDEKMLPTRDIFKLQELN
jgi:hypothetical protein